MSSSPSSVYSAAQRAWQYWFDDGLPTLIAGIGCLLVAIFLAYDHSSNSTPLTVAICFTALVLYGAVLLFERQIVEWLKARITYPRTGYAQAPYFVEDSSQPLDLLALSMQGSDAKRPSDIERLHKYRKQRLVLTCVVAAVATGAMMFLQNRWICAAAGIAMALALWFWGRKVQRVSWLILGGFPLVGFLLAIFMSDRLPGSERIAYFLAAAGVIFILDGALTLFHYLHAHPRPSQLGS